VEAAEIADAEHRKQHAEAERTRDPLPWRLPVSRLPPTNCAGWTCSSGQVESRAADER
jgi:hypothetical protein